MLLSALTAPQRVAGGGTLLFYPSLFIPITSPLAPAFSQCIPLFFNSPAGLCFNFNISAIQSESVVVEVQTAETFLPLR